MRIKFLSTHWRQNLESLGVLLAFLCLAILAISAYTTLNKYKTEFCYLMTQRFKLVKMNGRTLNRDCFSNIGSGELIIYTITVSFIGFLIFGASVPFIVTEEPLQHYFTQWTMSLLPTILIKCVVSLIYEIMAIYGSVIMITILLCFITFEEAIMKLSAELLLTLKLADISVRIKGSHLITLELEKRLILYRILQMLVTIGNSIISDYLAILGGIGIVGTSSIGLDYCSVL
ncbi:unnamed protein product [Orchesella dallaii]|uniref:Uncharacterized protein n=1 Tax=Orchesella dallaii TaxID=48710 RepID=A0ABP1PLH4_9HEXA